MDIKRVVFIAGHTRCKGGSINKKGVNENTYYRDLLKTVMPLYNESDLACFGPEHEVFGFYYHDHLSFKERQEVLAKHFKEDTLIVECHQNSFYKKVRQRAEIYSNHIFKDRDILVGIRNKWERLFKYEVQLKDATQNSRTRNFNSITSENNLQALLIEPAFWSQRYPSNEKIVEALRIICEEFDVDTPLTMY